MVRIDCPREGAALNQNDKDACMKTLSIAALAVALSFVSSAAPAKTSAPWNLSGGMLEQTGYICQLYVSYSPAIEMGNAGGASVTMSSTLSGCAAAATYVNLCTKGATNPGLCGSGSENWLDKAAYQSVVSQLLQAKLQGKPVTFMSLEKISADYYYSTGTFAF